MRRQYLGLLFLCFFGGASLLTTGCAFLGFQTDSGSVRTQPASAILRLNWQKDLVPHLNFEYFGHEWAGTAYLSNGDIVAGTSLGDLVRFSSAGQERSRTRLSAGVTTDILKDDANGQLAPNGRSETLFFGMSSGAFVRYDLSAQSVTWSFDTKAVLRGRPIISGGLIIFTTSLNQVIALEKSTGKWRWQYDGVRPERYCVDGFASIAIDRQAPGDPTQPSKIYTGFSNGEVVALDPQVGKVAWKADLRGEAEGFFDVDTTPIVRSDRVYVGNYATGVFALSGETGDILWKNTDAISVTRLVDLGVSGSFDEDNGFLALSAKAGVFRISEGGEVSWVVRSSIGIPSTGSVAVDDVVIIGGSTTGLHAISQHDGQLLQYFDPRGGIHANISVSGRHISTITNKGRLLSFSMLR